MHELDAPYLLRAQDIAAFRENGFIRLKNVFSPEMLEHYGPEITRLTIALNTQDRPMEERTTYEKAFLQIMNLWEQSAIAKEFVFGKRLARIAAELLEIDGVRLYHDQSLYKEPGGGVTPTHADQYYWPLASDRTITAWIPLQAVSADMGPLAFYARSQSVPFGRDLPISDESEREISAQLQAAGYDIVGDPFELGEISFHLGWTFHRAQPNVSHAPRSVMTIIYMDADMRLKAPSNEQQQNDWNTWCPGAKIGELIETPKNPVLYRAS